METHKLHDVFSKTLNAAVHWSYSENVHFCRKIPGPKMSKGKTLEKSTNGLS